MKIDELHFIWLSKMDDFMLLNNQLEAFSINLNAQHVNGVTHFLMKIDRNTCTVNRYSRVQLLQTNR